MYYQWPPLCRWPQSMYIHAYIMIQLYAHIMFALVCVRVQEIGFFEVDRIFDLIFA